MNKKLKITLISVFTVFLGIVLAIQSVPFFINGEQFKGTIYKSFEDSTDLKLQVKKINLSGAPFLKAKITFDEPFIQTKKGEPVFYSQKASASVNIIPLLLKQVQISDVKLISPDFYVVKEKTGKFNFEKTTPAVKKPKKNNFKIITDGMDIFVKDYQIEFLDKTTPKPLDTKAKGKKIQISGLNSKFGTKITTDGALAINNIRCLNYDIKTEIDMPEFMKYQEEHPLTQMEESSPVNPLYEISRNCVRANLIADLKIKTPEDIHGEATLDKLSLKLNGKRLPDSHIKIKAKKDKFFADAKLYITPQGIIDLNGEFKKDFIDCKLKTSHMQLNEVQMFTNAVLASMGKPLSDLEKLKIQGDLFADLKLKSDMKTIKSSGFLKVNNAQINYNKGILVIKSFNSNIKLNNNNIQFLNTGGIIDNNKFQINGNIDKNANAKIKIIVPSINIKSITENKDIKVKLSNISKIDGKVSAIINLTGKLDKPKYQGNLTLSKVNFGIKNNPAKISFAVGKLNLDSEKALLNIPKININKSAFTLNGTIPVKDKKSPANITAKGKLKASDLAVLINSGAIGHGEVPTICNVLIDKDAVKINLQILNDAYNNILIQGIGSNSVLSAHADLNGKTIKISDAGLFKTKQKSLNPNFESNLSGTTQIATATGAIQTIGNQKIFENIKIKVLNPIKISLPLGKNTVSEITGNTTINGTSKNPDIQGDFILLNTIIPDLKAKISKSTVSFKNKKITANILNFSSGKTGLNAQTTIDIKSTDPVVIENLNVKANTFNADEIFGLLGKMNPKKPQKIEYSLNKNNTMHLSPVVIKSGTVSAKVFILNDVPCYNLISNLTLDRYNMMKAENLSTATLKGTINGNITHDMITSVTLLDLKARGIDVGLFGEKFLGMPPGQIEGIGSSNMKLAFRGANSDEIVKSMHGALNLKVLDGEMGDLGRIDYYLRAANILSNNILSLSINRVLNGVRLKRTGEFEQAYGHLTFIPGGIIRIDTFKTVGPRLSLVMKGYVNNINLNGSINVYGRLSEEVVGILGPLGDFSIEKALQKVPVLDTLTHFTIGLVETNVPDNIRAEIPPLSIQGASSQEFTAKINGNVTKPSSVKTFRWIRTPVASNPYFQQGQTLATP